ncbi:MAG: enoyl-CoA hydratase/isomerase family protein [Bdellovibrionaceae bacterium]|nr:enoyl-CoA hydratase/isomerase family protein [Pseudobdellovibrionaceae bacterium]
MYKQIVFEKENSIAHVTLNRPEVRNAFNPEMIQEITKAFKDIQKDKKVRAVVLSGMGVSFCSGADLEWMKSMAKYTYAQNVKDAQKLYDMFAAIRDCDATVVAKVHGAVMGGALGLVSVCDVVLAETKTLFCFSEVRLGLAPAVISSFVKNKMRFSEMQRYFVTGAVFSAEEAKHSGLIHQIVDSTLALNQMQEVLLKEEVLAAAPQAVRETKKLLRTLSTLNTEVKAKSATTKLIAKLRVSEEGQEGLKSFFDKRKPKWRQS